MIEPTFSDKLGANAIYYIGGWIERTAKYQLNGGGYFHDALKGDKPIIFAAWHGMTLALICMFRKHLNLASVTILLPDDWRGTTLKLYCQKVGTHPYPVNLEGEEPMKTARQLVGLVKEIKRGQHAYISPDGPSGPSHIIKPGLTYIAQKAGAIILPMGAYARRGYRLNRWDRYLVPYPYNRISVEVGEPIVVEKGDDLTAVNHHLTHILNKVTLQAEANFYELDR